MRVAAGAAAAALLGCAAPPDRAAELRADRRAPIELAQDGKIFTVATALSAERSAAARQREAAARATGALLVPFVDGAGQPLLASNGTQLRGSCGVTFIAPSYAVTAAHCVDGTTSDLGGLMVEMYRPTPELESSYRQAPPLAGSFPDFSHPRLTAADGYVVDRFACTLVSRCSDLYGGRVSCGAQGDADAADAALLRCSGAPGRQYGFLAVAAADDPAAEVFMPWKHEVYDTPDDPPPAPGQPADDRFSHYVALGSGFADNYHYFGVDRAGVEQNQLLPLISVGFADGTPHHKLSASTSGVGTDLFGCHGTSGSGVLQPGAAGRWELLGPIAPGNPEHLTYLCDHIPSLDGTCRDPGCLGLGYVGLDTTRLLIARSQVDITADCDPFGGGATTLYTHLGCWLDHLTAGGADAPFAARLAPATAAATLELAGGPVAVLSSGESVGLGGFVIAAGESYRVGLSAWLAGGGCTAAAGCPRLAVSLDGREILVQVFDANVDAATGAGAEPRALAATFVAASTGAATLQLAFSGGDRIELGGLTLTPEAQRQTFDSEGERLAASLFEVDAAGAVSGAPQPMRFVGDGRTGFAAWLLAGERMVVARQAIAPGHRWTARLRASPPGPLTCGLVDPSGQVLRQADCSSGLVQLDDTGAAGATAGGSPAADAGAPPSSAPAAAGPAGFFVQTAADSAPTSVDDLQLVSDALPDSDGDSIPDALDPCPRGPEPIDGSLTVSLPAASAFEVCRPEPALLTMPLPQILGACDPPTVVGRLVTVNGRALDPLVVGVSGADGQVLLPLGRHTVAWEIRDGAAHVYQTVTQVVTVTQATGSACCPPAPERCTLAAGGAGELLVGGVAADWIAGGAGGDYLAGGGGDDVLLGGDGDDYLGGGRGGALTVYAGAGDDTIHARFADSARIFGGAGADVLIGGDGPDAIFPGGGPGATVVLAGGGDDTVTLYDVCQLVSGLRLSGGDGDDTLVSPVTVEELAQAGVQVDGFEHVAVDATHAYLAECF